MSNKGSLGGSGIRTESVIVGAEGGSGIKILVKALGIPGAVMESSASGMPGASGIDITEPRPMGASGASGITELCRFKGNSGIKPEREWSYSSERV